MQVLRTKGYWGSYNRAFYPELFELTGAPELVEKYGDWFTHDKTPRAKIMERDHGKVGKSLYFRAKMFVTSFKVLIACWVLGIASAAARVITFFL